MKLHSSYNVFSVVIALAICLGFGGLAVAQTLIPPIGQTPGGQSGNALDTSSTEQRKTGSLILGVSGSPASICLNADPVNDLSDPTKCIDSWADLNGVVGGPFVTRYQVLTGTAESGYASLQVGPQVYALKATANTLQSNSTAIYASIGLDTNRFDDNRYAAYFSGRLYITKTTTNADGQLCLNGTDLRTTGNPGGHCIQHWTDIGPAANVPYLARQSNIPLIPQVGAAKLDGPSATALRTLSLGSLVVGGPSVAQPTKTFCGDLLCSEEIGEYTFSSPNYCPSDCVAAPATPGVPPGGGGSCEDCEEPPPVIEPIH